MRCKWCDDENVDAVRYRYEGTAFVVEFCPTCDRRACPSCGQRERSGVATRCSSCGADVRLNAS